MAQPTDGSITEKNRQFYDGLWSRARLKRPEQFNTWPLVSSLLPSAPRRLELGPGLHPHLPIAGTHFIDLSEPAVRQLNARGGIAAAGDVGALPFPDGAFDLVAGFDVIEHLEDDRRVFQEVSRVLSPGGTFIFSVPLHAARWTEFDAIVGHVRRYEPAALVATLAECGFALERSAGFGMKPANDRVVGWGMWFLTHHTAVAMRWYNRVFLPLGLLFQKPLKFSAGMIDADAVQGVVVVCRSLTRRIDVARASSPCRG